MLMTRAGAAGRRAQDDAGVTLIEVVMAMAIMSFFLSIFTAGVVQMYRTANDAEAGQAMQSRLNLVFERLDVEIRYAAAISKPATVGGAQYVEYLNTNGGARLCTQLRLADGGLQRRTWAQGSAPSGGWTTLAGRSPGERHAGDTEISGNTAFRVTATTNQRQQLLIELTASFGESDRTTQFLFTALNSSVSAANDTICADGRSNP